MRGCVDFFLFPTVGAKNVCVNTHKTWQAANFLRRHVFAIVSMQCKEEFHAISGRISCMVVQVRAIRFWLVYCPRDNACTRWLRVMCTAHTHRHIPRQDISIHEVEQVLGNDGRIASRRRRNSFGATKEFLRGDEGIPLSPVSGLFCRPEGICLPSLWSYERSLLNGAC